MHSGTCSSTSTYGEILPDVCVSVLPQAFVVEAVHLGDLAGLVVAAQYRDALAVTNLKKETNEYYWIGCIDLVNYKLFKDKNKNYFSWQADNISFSPV